MTPGRAPNKRMQATRLRRDDSDKVLLVADGYPPLDPVDHRP